MADSVKIKITGDDKEFQSTLSGIGQKAGSVFKGMMASQIVTKGISLLTNGLKSAINTGMQFEAAMSQVAAISGATGQELELLTETAKHYGETTMFSASQAAEALNYMALAGWDAQQSVDALGGVLSLAAASGMDLGRASDAVTDYLSAFGMQASQSGYMADLMAYAQSNANTSASQLADAYGNCAASMHAAGQDIETTTAMLMALANQGIKGSEAGTQMSAVMRDLTSKMKNGQIMIGKTAVKATDAAGNFRDLNDIMIDVGKATQGMGTAEASAALMKTFTARSVKAVQTILNEGMDSVNAYEAALRGSTGTAAEQAEIMMDNLQGDIQIYKSAMEGLQITASESTNGIARSLVQEATSIIDAVNQGGKKGGLQGMADAAIAQIPSLLPKVVKGVKSLLSGLGKQLPGLVKGLIATLPDILGSAGDLVPGLIDSLSEAISAAVEGTITNLPQIVSSLAVGLGKSLVAAMKGVGNVTHTLIDTIFGVKKPTEYKSFGKLTGELTYAVDTQANVANSGASKDVENARKAFVSELQGYGLTNEDIIKILGFNGSEAEIIAQLSNQYPNLSDVQKKAIAAKMSGPEGKSIKSAVADLKEYGLTADEIAELLTLDEAELEDALKSKLPNLKDVQIHALQAKMTSSQDAGTADFVTEGTKMGLTVEQIAQMLALTGTEEQIKEGIKKIAPNLTDVQVQALAEHFKETGSEENLAKITEGLEDFGLKPDQIAQLLVTQMEGGDIEEALKGMLPDIQGNMRNAIIAKFNENGGMTAGLDALAAELGDSYGLTPDQIASLLVTKAEGGDAALEEAIKGMLPDIDSATRKAIISKFNENGDLASNVESLIAELGDIGLSDAQIATLLTTQMQGGDLEGAIKGMLPDITTAARNAILNKFNENGGLLAGLKEGLSDLGIKDEDIATLLTYKAEGDDTSIEELLEDKYKDIKQQAITALENAWNNSPATFSSGVGDSSLPYVTQLLTDMFTDGIPDDDQSVDAMLKNAKAAIDTAKQKLNEYIAEGGEDTEGAKNALSQLDELESALTNYATNYANASKTVCEEQGKVLQDMAKQCQDTVDSITASTQQLLSVQEILFNQGKSGAKLSEADLAGAMLFISTKYQQARKDADKAKEEALQANKSYKEAEAAYQAALTKALGESTRDIAALIKGQMGDVEGLDVGAALASIWDDMFSTAKIQGTLREKQVEDMLRNAGFGDDIIGKALAQVFGEQQYNTVSYGDMVNHDFGEDVNDFLYKAFSSRSDVSASELANRMRENGFDEGIISDVMSQLFKPEDMSINWDELNLDQIIGTLDFGPLGEILKTAIDNGLIEGIESSEGLDINQLILEMIAEASKGGENPTIDTTVDANVETGEITTEEGTSEKVAEAVEEASEGGEATASPTLKVEPEVEAAEGTDQKIAQAAEQAVSGTDEQASQTVSASVDLEMTLGNVTIAEGSDFSDKIKQLIPETTNISATANVDLSVEVSSNGAAAGESVGAEVASGVQSGISNGAGGVNTAARQLIPGAVSAASGQTSGAIGLGLSFSSGLAAGIRNGKSSVVNAAAAVARAAAAAARAALSINSPSRVTRALGEGFDEGFVVGINKESENVRRSVVNMMDNVIGAANLRPKMDFSDIHGAMGDAIYDLAEIEGERPVVLQVNGRELARVTAADNARASVGYNRSIALGVGK